MAAPVEVTTPQQVLSERQLCRVECLKAARFVLVAKNPLSQGAADPIDLVQIARFIETGEDPYATVRQEVGS